MVFFVERRKSVNKSGIYDIKLPGALVGLCVAWFVVGAIFTTIMLISSKYTDTVTNGHYYLGLTFIIVGLIGFIFCQNWKVTVSEKNIIHTSVFGITKEYSKDDITDAKLGNKKELVIRFKNGELTIDPATTNYFRLVCEVLEE